MFADCAVVKLEYWSTTQTQQVSVENVNDLGELQTEDGGSLLMGILNTRAVREICDVPCSPIPMTRGSCSCHKHILNSVHRVSWPPVLDCGTTFHRNYGGREWHLTPSDSLWNLIYLATEVLTDSIEFIGTIQCLQCFDAVGWAAGRASGL